MINNLYIEYNACSQVQYMINDGIKYHVDMSSKIHLILINAGRGDGTEGRGGRGRDDHHGLK